MRVVVVGSGIAGLAAARTVSKYDTTAEVILVEEQDRVGGHSYTVATPNEESVDIGFMVMNDLTYPNLLKLFEEVDAKVEASDMSFSVFDNDFSWSFQGGAAWLLRNVWRPRLLKFALAHGKFAGRARAFLLRPEPLDLSMRDFCRDVDPLFVDRWLVPFVAAVWSTPPSSSLDMAALPLLRFMHHHMFLTLETVAWTTPSGRSSAYVKKLLAACPNIEVRLNTKATRVIGEEKVLLLADGTRLAYDALILAGSAPSQAALQPPAKEWLSRFRTNAARICVHSSPYGMPDNKADWSSWNVRMVPSDGAAVNVTYWLSKLQNLRDQSVFLTLNPDATPAGTFFQTTLQHPVMDVAAFLAQREEHSHQGLAGVYHAGAWLRSGFHEDGCVSGILAARRALGRRDIPVAFPSLSGLLAEPVKGVSTHTRSTEGFQYSKPYDLHLFRFDTRAPPPGFERQDHFGDHKVPLDTCVRQELARRVGVWPLGAVTAVCNLRYAGCCFNPITPYFAHDETGKLEALLLEVHNTPWGERTLYAMRVGEDGALDPATHRKDMHVSPFNPPPEDAAQQYTFRLVGEEQLFIAVSAGGRPVMTASWKLTGGGHDVRTGSLRTFVQVYVMAGQLFRQGLPMFGYDVPRLHWSSPLLLSQAGFMGVALGHVVAGGSWCFALLFGALTAALVAHHRYGGVNVALHVLITVIAAACIGVNAYFLTSDHLPEVFCALASFVVFALSLLCGEDRFVELRTMAYVNAVLGSLSLVVRLPSWLHITNAWITLRITLRNGPSVGSHLGLVAALLMIASVWFLLNFFAGAGAAALFGFDQWRGSDRSLAVATCILQANAATDLLMSGDLVGRLASVAFWALAAWLGSAMTGAALKALVLVYLFARGLRTGLAGSKAWRRLLDAALVRVADCAVRAASGDRVCVAGPGLQGKSAIPCIQVNDPLAFLGAVCGGGELGLGESFMRGEWEEGGGSDVAEILTQLASLLASPLAYLPYLSPSFWLRRVGFTARFGALDKAQSAASIAEHYDDGNELFRAFLGEDMVYTSALFEGTADLAAAQRKKVGRILDLANAPRRLLDIGSGWGYLVHAATQRGVDARGICNCKSMIAESRRRYGEERFSLHDYRDLAPTHEYDAVTAVEMIEAVPARHYPEFASACDRALRPGGRVVMQVIHAYPFNNPVARTKDPVPLGTFTTTHIFPGQQIPNLDYLHEAFLDTGKFRRVYTETTSHDYVYTLRAWRRNLERAAARFPATTVRKYRYYLAFCEVGFDCEMLHLSRVVFEKRKD